MKSWLHFLALATLALVLQKASAQDMDAYKAMLDTCLKRHEITGEEFDGLKEKGVTISESDFQQKHKCFLHCLLEEGGYLDENGKANVDKIKQEKGLPDDKAAALMKCKDDYNEIEEVCEYSFKVFMCGFMAMVSLMS